MTAERKPLSTVTLCTTAQICGRNHGSVETRCGACALEFCPAGAGELDAPGSTLATAPGARTPDRISNQEHSMQPTNRGRYAPKGSRPIVRVTTSNTSVPAHTFQPNPVDVYSCWHCNLPRANWRHQPPRGRAA